MRVYIDLGELAYPSANDIALVWLFPVPSKASNKTMMHYAPIPVVGLRGTTGWWTRFLDRPPWPSTPPNTWSWPLRYCTTHSPVTILSLMRSTFCQGKVLSVNDEATYRPISDIRLGLFSRPRSDRIFPGMTLVWPYFGSCVDLTSVGSYMQNTPNQNAKMGLVWFCLCYQLPKQHMPTTIEHKDCKGKTPQPQPPRAPRGDIQVATVVATDVAYIMDKHMLTYLLLLKSVITCPIIVQRLLHVSCWRIIRSTPWS